MANEYEKLLEDLLDDEQGDVVPKSAMEAALLNAIDSEGLEGLDKPRSRVEAYLAAFAERVKDVPYDSRKTVEHKMPIQLTETPFPMGRECFREHFGSLTMYFYKLSDLAPSYEEFFNAEVEMVDKEGQAHRAKFGEEFVCFTDNSNGVTMYVATMPDVITFITFVGFRGVYAVLDNENGECKFIDDSVEAGVSINLVLNCTTGELKTIDEKYLPKECIPKEINIADDIPNGLFIGEYFYQLFVKGGGLKTENVGNHESGVWYDFFNQFAENRPYTFVLPIVSIGAVLKTQQVNVNMKGDGVREIVCTFLSNQNGYMMRIICAMARQGSTEIVFSVIVEPLTIPSNNI